MPPLLALAFLAAPQSADAPLPQFEVASVKPINPNARNAVDIKVLPGGRVIVTAASLLQLIAGAYGGLQYYQVEGPAWINDAFFDIQAEPTENDYGAQPTVLVMGRDIAEKTALRLRALLIERFHLQTHFESRDHTLYDLVVAKGGSKLKQASDPSEACEGGWRAGGGGMFAKGCSMAWMADRLARFAFRTDVFDKTGLTGRYDFDLSFTPVGPFAPVRTEADPSGTPSIFSAIQTLGLKLEARKAPMQVVVVDHVEKLTGN